MAFRGKILGISKTRSKEEQRQRCRHNWPFEKIMYAADVDPGNIISPLAFRSSKGKEAKEQGNQKHVH